MSGLRLKPTLLLAGAALSGALLLTWTQQWFDLVLTDAQKISVTGEVAAGALSALGLSGLALAGALAIAGPVFRVVLGVLQILIGLTAGLSSVLAIAQPAAAASPAISAATGVAGEAVNDQIDSLTLSPWPVVALVASIGLAVIGVLVATTARRWPDAARKYQTTRLEPADAARSSVDDWDSLSSGDDPTR